MVIVGIGTSHPEVKARRPKPPLLGSSLQADDFSGRVNDGASSDQPSIGPAIFADDPKNSHERLYRS
ncbi:hypothetical protein [Bradyrhizobium sp. BR 1433]|uniref:hypothetical protein n=1 Tax=Bradyrhizobium sp. BR 1433 TaxID=3447967 RepID=UPI003EE5A99D